MNYKDTKKSYDEIALGSLTHKEINPSDTIKDATHAVLGLTTELGEVSELVKKSFVNNTEIPRYKLIEEVGDMMWYLALLLRSVNATTELAQQVNLAKTDARYHGKFSDKKYDRNNRNYANEEQAIIETVLAFDKNRGR